jgi:purine-binding chemotaxis protein CheW
MKTMDSFLLFSVGDVRYALDVAVVERIVFAAETTPLADAPETVLGLINIAGEIMPVINVRRRLGFPPRDMELENRFIVTRATGAPLALLVEAVEGVVKLPAQSISIGNRETPWTTAAAVGDGGGVVLIESLEALVSADDLAKVNNSGVDMHE